MFLSGLHLLGDNADDLHIVDDMLAQVNDTEDQRQHRAKRRTPADAKAFGLPDDKGNGQQENQ